MYETRPDYETMIGAMPTVASLLLINILFWQASSTCASGRWQRQLAVRIDSYTCAAAGTTRTRFEYKRPGWLRRLTTDQAVAEAVVSSSTRQRGKATERGGIGGDYNHPCQVRRAGNNLSAALRVCFFVVPRVAELFT
jgi:hypothetical protein